MACVANRDWSVQAFGHHAPPCAAIALLATVDDSAARHMADAPDVRRIGLLPKRALAEALLPAHAPPLIHAPAVVRESHNDVNVIP